MKTSKFHLLAIALFVGLFVASCNKDNSSSSTGSLSTSETAVAQDAESQDAQADNVDQSIDNITDALETNDFSAVKSAQVGAPMCDVDHPDTTYFPKVITLTFNTDTTINNELFKQTGVITIKVERTSDVGPWRSSLKRTITFDNFKTQNDSAIFTVNGTRVMTRKNVSLTPAITSANILTLTSLRLSVLDSVKSNFTFTITCGNFTGNFTRNMNRTRQAITHFEKIRDTRIWHQALLKDTMILKGSVIGTNLMDSTYSRVISETEPVTITRCVYLVPVISSGKITATRATPNGEKTATISYSKDGCRTLVTVTNANGKTREFDRKVNRMYKKWW
jgi:hypothetical protein